MCEESKKKLKEARLDERKEERKKTRTQQEIRKE
jgi:hypothetical protein